MKKIIKKEVVGIQPVFSTNVQSNGNYVSEGDIINKNCVIDQDYQGELILNLHNISTNYVEIAPGEKIVQGILFKINYAVPEAVRTVEELYPEKTERGEGGFGSTN